MTIRILILFFFGLSLTLFSCRQSKHVPEGKYLLKKNKVEIDNKNVDDYDVRSVIKQEPNHKTVGFKLKLTVFNAIDSAKVARKRERLNDKIDAYNEKHITKVERINKKRIKKALAKGKGEYKPKKLNLKDTLEPRKFLREWLKYEFGQAPVVFDSSLTNRSLVQIEKFMQSKGYYNSIVSDSLKFQQKARKATVTYFVKTGEPYIVDSVYVKAVNKSVLVRYEHFKKDPHFKLEPPFIFDTDVLDEQRELIAKEQRDDAKFGFAKTHISFEADTTLGNHKVKLGIVFKERYIKDPIDKEKVIKKPFGTTKIKKVIFHIVDTTYLEGNYANLCEQYGVDKKNNGYVQTFDTLVFDSFYNSENSPSDSAYRVAEFYYNGKLVVKPELLEYCNFLENDNVYKEYYVTRSYNRLIQLKLFQSVKPVLIEVPGKREIEVHYYLVPKKKQSFGYETKATNSNGFLGLAASINYKNKNLFRGGEEMTFSFGGGFESQPNVFNENLDGSQDQNLGRSLNTFEFGPSIKFNIPGIRPFLHYKKLSKRHYPQTIISAAYSIQQRDDFNRQLMQLNYGFKFNVMKKQVVQLGFPFLSGVQYVNLDKTPEFQQRLEDLNDLFLLNTYSDQFIWKDIKASYEITNKATTLGNFIYYYQSDLDIAGTLLQLLTKNKAPNTEGYKEIFGVRYSEFVRLDNEIKLYYNFKNKKSINFKFNVGAGVPLKNNGTSLPFDYSFFGGGANDNRGWRARALGPGTYKYYIDSNRTLTQAGDIRIGGTAEFRFSLGTSLRGALFCDVGNIWTMKEDPNRLGSKFSSNWINELGVATGFGLRLDLEFFIIRFDIGIPIRNPALPKNERWIGQSRDQFEKEAEAYYGSDYEAKTPFPFVPQLHLGIGYPF